MMVKQLFHATNFAILMLIVLNSLLGRGVGYLNRCDLYRATDCAFTNAYNFDIYRPSKICKTSLTLKASPYTTETFAYDSNPAFALISTWQDFFENS